MEPSTAATAKESRAVRGLAEAAAATRFSTLAPAVVHQAQRMLRDALALGLYGADQPGTRKLATVVGTWRGQPQSSAFAHDQRMACVDAALLNGASIHAVDFDDTFGPGLAHLSAAIVPAVLAVAEWKGLDGAAVLASWVAGSDAAARIALATNPRAMAARGFHPTGCYGTYGAAVAAARALNLDSDGISRAIGLAAMQASGLMVNVGTMAKPLHAGKAAANGVLAALLAAQDFTSGDPFLGPSGAASFSGVLTAEMPALDFHGASLMQTTLKPYPSCWLTHGAIDAALALRTRCREEVIERVSIRVGSHAASVCDRSGSVEALDRKFSLQYVVAAALVGGEVGLAQFVEGEVCPADVGRLMARAELFIDKALNDGQACVEVGLGGGRTETVSVATSTGTPECPLGDATLHEKVRAVLSACGRGEPSPARGRWSRGRQDAWIGLIGRGPDQPPGLRPVKATKPYLCSRLSIASSTLLTAAAKSTSNSVIDIITSTLCSPMAFISM